MKYSHFIAYCLFALFIINGPAGYTQDSTGYRSKKGSSSKVRKAAEDLKASFKKDDEAETARQYESLSREFEAKGDFAKAEENMKKALDIYSRLNMKPEMAAASRYLARTQESQNKIVPAIKNYQAAAEAVEDKKLEQANFNDANRLRNTNNPKAQMDYAQSNANLFEEQGKKDEAANALKQLAKTQLEQNKPEEAIGTYKKAIETSNKPEETDKLKGEIVKAYVADNQLDKAIAVSRDLLNKAKAEKDTEQEIIQLRQLAGIYQEGNNDPKTEALLKESYALAINTNNTIQAKTTLAALVQFYSKTKQDSKSLFYYQDFTNKLDSMIKADSSLIDTKIFEVTENRIRELENERKLQNELMARTTRFNYVLIGSVLLMLILVFLVARALYAIRRKNKRIALQSLRREMNPHFIFNSLNSVNQYIAENNELEANKYLTSYSSLMRNFMENSNKDFVPLSVELDQIRKYLALEHQRFHDKFEYEIVTDDNIDPDVTMVPNMLIQPHIENAIWHGLRYKPEKGKLSLSFTKRGQNIEVKLTDDGIGLTKSKQLKTEHQKVHQSRGITNTRERMSLLNDLYKTRISMDMQEINDGTGTGTIVTISMPLITRNNAERTN